MSACFCSTARALLDQPIPVPSTDDLLRSCREHLEPPEVVDQAVIAASIGEIDSQLKTALKLEEQLAQRRYQLLHLRNLQASARAPVHRVYYDVLVEIFDLYSQQNQQDTDGIIGPVECPTFLLGQVCKFWRTTVYDTPRLWTHLRVNLAAMTPDNLQLLKIALDASRAQPLHLSICYCAEAEPWPDSLLSQAADAGFILLSRQAHRWQTVSCVTRLYEKSEYLSTLLGNYLRSVSTPFPVLRSVKWVTKEPEWANWRSEVLQPFAQCQILERLSIPVIHPKGQANLIQLPLLRELRIVKYFAADALFNLLRLLPALEACWIENIRSSERELPIQGPRMDYSAPVHDSALRRLTLGRIEGQERRFLEGTKLGELDYLSISGCARLGWASENVEPLLELLDQCQKLRELVLCDFTDQGRSILEQSIPRFIDVTVVHGISP